jgi:hypothetical protein
MKEAGVYPGCCLPMMYTSGLDYFLLAKFDIEIIGIGFPIDERQRLLFFVILNQQIITSEISSLITGS